MKIIRKLIIASGLCAIAFPALACDMHGSGMHFTPASKWKSFSPRASRMDPAFIGDSDQTLFDFTDPSYESTPPSTRNVRPSFSSAADRASTAARTRVMMMGKSQGETEVPMADPSEDTDDGVAVGNNLQSDAQPSR